MDRITLPKVKLHGIDLPIITISDDSKYNNMGYIKNGLIFHLDGINKGPNEGAWTDLINGVKFTPTDNRVVFGGNYVSGNLISDVALLCPISSSTIEISYHYDGNVVTGLFLNTGRGDNVAIGITQSNLVIPSHNSTYGKVWRTGDCSTGDQLLSVNDNLLVHNEVAVTNSACCNYWGLRTNVAAVGDYAYGQPVQIHSVRIYNRLLSEEEMLYNQNVDVKRFGLTPIMPVMTMEFQDELCPLDNRGL